MTLAKRAACGTLEAFSAQCTDRGFGQADWREAADCRKWSVGLTLCYYHRVANFRNHRNCSAMYSLSINSQPFWWGVYRVYHCIRTNYCDNGRITFRLWITKETFDWCLTTVKIHQATYLWCRSTHMQSITGNGTEPSMFRSFAHRDVGVG